MPSAIPFGYLFIPKGEEELIWNTLIAYLPISCSLKRVRVLFDQSLRESLFDVLSYQLGMKLDKGDIAVAFRDSSLGRHKDDYEAMEKLFLDGKLTNIVLMEASIRFKKTEGNITASDVQEFSKLVRKIADIDALVIRVASQSTISQEVLDNNRNLILLARGSNIVQAVNLATELQTKGYELFSSTELEFSNPEIGTWSFEGEKPRNVSYMRVWLKCKTVKRAVKKRK
jgi:DNA-binding protein